MRHPKAVGDVRVIGLVTPTHLIEDIQVSVPRGVAVLIPALKAARSKDLWRGINQKCLFQLPSSAGASAGGPTPSPTMDLSGINQRLQALENENRELRNLILQGHGQNAEKLSAILTAIQSGSFVMQAGSMAGPAAAPTPKEEIADGAAPAFIPAEIRPKEAETRIGSKAEEAASSVSDAVGALRKFRKGNGEPQ